ncbi:MAG: phosphatidylinositol-3-phosphatase, partial [Solirubrobacteraceae bacterium]|nr:phosphatidylinositol-3-phosphatase [Solirubrobacteraceae bacterium]
IPGARVAVVVLENHGPGAVLSRGWLAHAARGGGRAINAYGEQHPSQPYFVMLSGAVRPLSDARAVAHPSSRPNLIRQLDTARVSWRAYMESMPSACFDRTSSRDTVGRYAKRHDPFLFFTDLTNDAHDCRSDLVPGTSLGPDIARGQLRRFTWITPNLCQDMHSCPVAAGERWMAATLPPLLRALGPRGVLFVVGDERSPAGSGGGRIPLVALGAGVLPGSTVRARVNHRSLLATIEDVLGLGRLSTTRTARTLRPLLRG